MRRILPLFILFGVLLPLLSAQASPPIWSWNTYTGSVSWQVTATEDDTGCGQGVNTEQFSISIQHNGATAVMGDVGHGPATGTFISPNILHIPARTVSDPPGTSKISDYDIFFTTDCSAFAARYTWDYSDQYGSCSGSTSLSGSNSQGCPAQPPSEDTEQEKVIDARKDLRRYLDLKDKLRDLEYWQRLGVDNINEIEDTNNKIFDLETSVNMKYRAILNANPKSFFANWDMAQKALSDGNGILSYLFLNAALNNLTESMKNTMQKNMANKLGFSKPPTKENSAVVREESSEGDNWQGSIYGQDFQKEYSDKSTRGIKLFATLGSPTDVMDSTVVT